jgi:hypothetical protein
MSAQRIWELHASMLGGRIRTTPEGDAEIDGGLFLSEKAYLLAVRDFRPRQLLEMVQRDGPRLTADHLIAHYSRPESLDATGGRSLVSTWGSAPAPIVRRSDEVGAPAPALSR